MAQRTASDRAVEHGEKAVTRTFNKSSVMLDNRGVDEFAPMSLHPRVCVPSSSIAMRRL